MPVVQANYRHSYDVLVSSGVPGDLIVKGLHRYSFSNTNDGRGVSKHMLQALRKLKGAIDLGIANIALEDEERECLPIDWPGQYYKDVLDSVTECSVNASILEGQLEAFTSRKGSDRDEASLVYLHLCILKITRKPHWTDMVDLLEAASIASGGEEEWNQDKLRKVIKRYGDTSPSNYGRLEVFAESEANEIVGSVHAGTLTPAMRRSTKNRIKKVKERAQTTYSFPPRSRSGREEG